MGVHEKKGLSDEWYTPKYIFDAMNMVFDLDVAHPLCNTNVPAKNIITENSLSLDWIGFAWMNPPWCNAKDKTKWVEKFVDHENGVALMPDSTSASWWQYLSKNSHAVLFLNHRVKFVKPDGTVGENPANGTCLFAIGTDGIEALRNAEKNGLGRLYISN